MVSGPVVTLLQCDILLYPYVRVSTTKGKDIFLFVLKFLFSYLSLIWFKDRSYFKSLQFGNVELYP